MVLGLDVSTSSTGWAVLHNDGTLVEMGSFNLSKLDGIFNKARAVNNGLLVLHERFSGIEQISIEEPLQGFRRGLSSAQTLLTLARFNGIVSWQASTVFRIDPTFINSSVARKGLGIKLDKERDTKLQIMEWVETRTGSPLPRRMVTAGKNKGAEVYAPGVNDAADAYVIAAALLNANKP
jgi:hypothetical protein